MRWIVLLLLWCAPLHADDLARARAHFTVGKDLFQHVTRAAVSF